MTYFIGIDVGGTFTDAAIMDDHGDSLIVKAPTTPDDPSKGLFDCLEIAARRFGIPLNDFLKQTERLTYGTTVATNLLVQGETAPVGLITTRGFGATLPIARIGREHLSCDLQFDPAPTLVPRARIKEVVERIDSRGEVIAPLAVGQARRCIDELLEKGIQSLAVCLLWSFKNDIHEHQIGEILASEYPSIHYSLSSQVAPVIGEYERTATTVINSQLVPPVRKHLEEVHEQLVVSGYEKPFLLMQSVGGVIPYKDVLQQPITLLNSGPAGGTLACEAINRVLGHKNVICFDMGGTTCDVSLILDGRFVIDSNPRVIGHGILAPMVDIRSIGAGGGSIAWLDMGKKVTVGPKSAGAEPGPACYARGGEEPTVTDADLILGYLNPQNFLGGRLTLDAEAARHCLGAKIARPLNLSLHDAAYGIVRIIEAQMADAIKEITISRGYDPREFVLFAFGGAGPLHVASVAEELGIKTVVITPYATVQSALGIMMSDVVHSFVVTDVMLLNDHNRVNSHLRSLVAKGRSLLNAEGFQEEAIEVRCYADMRYRGQFHEIPIDLPWSHFGEENLIDLANHFRSKYQAIYGREASFQAMEPEIVNLRVEAVGLTNKPKVKEYSCNQGSAQVKDVRSAFFVQEGGFCECPIYAGEELRSDSKLIGPCILEYEGTTVLVHPGQVAHVDRYLNVSLQIGL